MGELRNKKKPSSINYDTLSKRLIYVELLASRGMTDSQIANELGCNYATFRSWLNKYPELREAITSGRKPRVDRAEDKLMELIMGAVEEKTVETEERSIIEAGEKVGTRITETTTVKHQPNLSAITFFLCNNSDKYADPKSKSSSIGTNEAVTIINDIPGDNNNGD